MLIKDFDPSKLFKYYYLPYIKVRKNDCNQILTILKENRLILKLSRVSPIINDEINTENRLILFRDDLKIAYRNCGKRSRIESNIYNNNTNELEEYIIELSDNFYMKLPGTVFKKLSSIEFVEYGLYNLKVDYKYLSYNECIRQYIPDDIEIISSFETIGHISHLNLNQSTFPYRYIFGRILLDKNPGIKTVVTKTGNIENEYRTYPLEVIAGENNLKAKLKEQGIIYNISIDKVYWNSRLSNERQRILSIIPKESVVFDITCGVGAFTLPLVKINNCKVYSNDLNPEAIKLLNENIISNKLDSNKIVISQMDCVKYINQIMMKKLYLNEEDFYKNKVFYWICNLPELSLNTLNAFVPFKKALENISSNEKIIYTKNSFNFYCFSKDNNPLDDIEKRIYSSLEIDKQASDLELLVPTDLKIYNVRDVSPNKKMYCAQFNIIIPIKI